MCACVPCVRSARSAVFPWTHTWLVQDFKEARRLDRPFSFLYLCQSFYTRSSVLGPFNMLVDKQKTPIQECVFFNIVTTIEPWVNQLMDYLSGKYLLCTVFKHTMLHISYFVRYIEEVINKSELFLHQIWSHLLRAL